MDEFQDLSNEDLIMMRDYLDELSGVNKGKMLNNSINRGAKADGKDSLRAIMETRPGEPEPLRFDTAKAWEKVNARIGRKLRK